MRRELTRWRKRELVLAVMLIALLLRGITAVASLRQDEAAGREAVSGFEAASGHSDVSVLRLERYGTCAVVELEWPRSEAVVALDRDHEGWHYRGVIEGDTDDVTDRLDCIDALDSAVPTGSGP